MSTIYRRRTVFLSILIAIYVVAFSLTFRDSYLSYANISAILINMSIELLVIIGMALLLISGEFDLSLGATMSLSGILCGYLIKIGVGVALSISITFAVCVLFGVLNGVIVAKIGVNSFITTLATGIIIRGIAVRIAGPGILKLPERFIVLGQKVLGGLQLPVWYAVVTAAVFIYLVSMTRVFRQYYFIGGNPKAAVLSGINMARMKIIAFAIAACLSGFAGIVSAARFGNAMTAVGNGIEMRAITASVIGGISIKGGVGSIGGAILGALFIALLNNGVIIAEIDPYWQPIVLGIVLVIAVIIDVVMSRNRARAKQPTAGIS